MYNSNNDTHSEYYNNSAHNELTAAVTVLRADGVIVYPTEGVWGIGCDPFSQRAVERVLAIKRRGWEKGLIILVADLALLDGLVALPQHEIEQRIQRFQMQRPVHFNAPPPVTWLVPAQPTAPRWLIGNGSLIAFRQLTYPVLTQQLLRLFNRPLISTSANFSGEAPPTKRAALASSFIAQVDLVLPGEVGGLAKPTPIYNLVTGQQIRT